MRKSTAKMRQNCVINSITDIYMSININIDMYMFMMLDAFEVIKAWGFEYITIITWKKDKIGLWQYFRGNTEHCIFATTAKRLPYKLTEDGKRCQGVTGFDAERTVHSRKPEEMRRMIEKVSYAPRLELFARKHTDGWDCWGNEV